MTYDVRMGVDSINAGLKPLLDQAIQQNHDAIQKILQEYGVPIVNGEMPG